jgi:hypothetical protein
MLCVLETGDTEMNKPFIFDTIEIVEQGHDWARTVRTIEDKVTVAEAIEYAITGGFSLDVQDGENSDRAVECDYQSGTIRVFVEPEA